MYDYIPNEFGRTWVASRSEAKRGVFTPLAYIDINDGNRYDGDLFAQIMYWHEPSSETGKPRLSRKLKGDNEHYWLTKNHSDWFKETRIKYETVRKSLKRIQARNLIIYELSGEKGKVTAFIRVNWDEFQRRMEIWLSENIALIEEGEYDQILKNLFKLGVVQNTKVVGNTSTVVGNTIGLVQDTDSNTESTSKNHKDKIISTPVNDDRPEIDELDPIAGGDFSLSGSTPLTDNSFEDKASLTDDLVSYEMDPIKDASKDTLSSESLSAHREVGSEKDYESVTPSKPREDLRDRALPVWIEQRIKKKDGPNIPLGKDLLKQLEQGGIYNEEDVPMPLVMYKDLYRGSLIDLYDHSEDFRNYVFKAFNWRQYITRKDFVKRLINFGYMQGNYKGWFAYYKEWHPHYRPRSREELEQHYKEGCFDKDWTLDALLEYFGYKDEDKSPE